MSKQQPPKPTPTTNAQVSAAAAATPAKATPIVTALAFRHVPGQGWVSLIYRIQGDKVVAVEPSEPDIKPIAQEHFKIAVAKMLLTEPT